MDLDEYKKYFAEPHKGDGAIDESDTRAGRALDYAIDIRKFEIELYWKRATYFWTFIGVAFAGYALTYKTASEHEPWLSLIFASLGLIFSFAWYLVNRGSKFWQNNWERHVEILEDMTLGPLYKTIAIDVGKNNPLTSVGQFSVTKINQILSVFVVMFWVLLLVKSLLPISSELPPDYFKIIIVSATVLCLCLLYSMGRSSIRHAQTKLIRRSFGVEI